MVKSNNDRADRAQKAMDTYEPQEDEQCIRDLVCDLRHLADRAGLDWDQQVRIAMDNYTAELGEEDDEDA